MARQDPARRAHPAGRRHLQQRGGVHREGEGQARERPEERRHEAAGAVRGAADPERAGGEGRGAAEEGDQVPPGQDEHHAFDQGVPGPAGREEDGDRAVAPGGADPAGGVHGARGRELALPVGAPEDIQEEGEAVQAQEGPRRRRGLRRGRGRGRGGERLRERRRGRRDGGRRRPAAGLRRADLRQRHRPPRQAAGDGGRSPGDPKGRGRAEEAAQEAP
mmetsp:Transcript_116696/g.330696  ORF Transcript_116696/g.330696 Transcript_116696/m.330696 type:complete len:219 (+) Transcript_116696:1276-1932(+)